MCCMSDRCNNHKCRCICVRCRDCERCKGGPGSDLGVDVFMGITNGFAGNLMKQASRRKVKSANSPIPIPPSLDPPAQPTTQSQSAGLLKATGENCSIQ